MVPQVIAGALGVVVSVVFEIFPKAKEKFDKHFTPGQKALVMAGGGLAVVGAVFGLGCANLFGLEGTYQCTGEGGEQAFVTWVAFFMSNQSAFGVLHAAKKGREQPAG